MEPLLEHKKNPTPYLLKLYLGLAVISLVFYLFIKYFLSVQGLPTSFRKGVELLINNKEVISRIGSYTSYTFNKDQLPKETDNPAFFKIAISGDSAKTIYLTCKMQKMSSGSWALKAIKIDSLKTDH